MSGYYISRRAEYNVGTSTFFNQRMYADRPRTINRVQYPAKLDAVWSYRSAAPVGTETSDIDASIEANRIDFLRSKEDTGHPFWVEKLSCTPSIPINAKGIGSGLDQWLYESRIVASPTPGALVGNPNQTNSPWWFKFRPFPSMGELNAQGTIALDRTLVTKPAANVTQMLAELLSDLPRLGLLTIMGKGPKVTPASLGGDYLNVQFGWLPLWRDIQAICVAVQNSSKIINDFAKGSGQAHYVKATSGKDSLRAEVLKSESVNGIYATSAANTFENFEGTAAQNTFDLASARSSILQTESRSWRFSGSWSYLLAEGSSLLDKIANFEQQANHLLGLRMTPETLWNLAPWSWLADWFGTIGNVISVNSALQHDNLVLQFGYLTHRTVQRSLCSTSFSSRTGQRYNINTLYQAERLERIRATPYGFGFSMPDLNPSQLAILAALGFSQGSRTGSRKG